MACTPWRGHDLAGHRAVKEEKHLPREGKKTSPGPGGDRGVLGSESRCRPDSEGCLRATYVRGCLGLVSGIPWEGGEVSKPGFSIP